jgi:hypothetical protein
VATTPGVVWTWRRALCRRSVPKTVRRCGRPIVSAISALFALAVLDGPCSRVVFDVQSPSDGLSGLHVRIPSSLASGLPFPLVNFAGGGQWASQISARSLDKLCPPGSRDFRSRSGCSPGLLHPNRRPRDAGPYVPRSPPREPVLLHVPRCSSCQSAGPVREGCLCSSSDAKHQRGVPALRDGSGPKTTPSAGCGLRFVHSRHSQGAPVSTKCDGCCCAAIEPIARAVLMEREFQQWDAVTIGSVLVGGRYAHAHYG